MLAAVVFLAIRARQTDITLIFTREDLQQRLAAKFPFDQRLLFITVTYSNPRVLLNDGSDRVGLELDAAAKLSGDNLAKGHVAGDWQVRYEPAEGAFYFDNPKISRFEIEGLTPGTQEQVARVAKPLIEEYLRRVPVYHLKSGDIRQDLARTVLKSVFIKQGKLLIVVGAG